MFGYKTIQVTLTAAIMMLCYDARYLLVNIDGENGGGSDVKDFNMNHEASGGWLHCLTCAKQLIEPIEKCFGEGGVIACIEGLFNASPTCVECGCSIIDHIPFISQSLKDTLQKTFCKKALIGAACKTHPIYHNYLPDCEEGLICRPAIELAGKVFPEPLPGTCLKQAVKEKQLGESCGRTFNGPPKNCGDCAEGLECTPKIPKVIDWWSCGICREKKGGPKKILKKEWETCGEYACEPKRAYAGNCGEGLECNHNYNICGYGFCNRIREPESECKNKLDVCEIILPNCELDYVKIHCQKYCKLCPQETTTTTEPTTTTEATTTTTAGTYFNQTCCKEKGVPEPCMGRCISPRVLRQNRISESNNHDYAESSYASICDNMDSLIDQCIVELPNVNKLLGTGGPRINKEI